MASHLAKGLERFRLRRSMGLGGFFGEHKLSGRSTDTGVYQILTYSLCSENMTPSHEMQVASSILVKDIRDIL